MPSLSIIKIIVHLYGDTVIGIFGKLFRNRLMVYIG